MSMLFSILGGLATIGSIGTGFVLLTCLGNCLVHIGFHNTLQPNLGLLGPKTILRALAIFCGFLAYLDNGFTITARPRRKTARRSRLRIS